MRFPYSILFVTSLISVLSACSSTSTQVSDSLDFLEGSYNDGIAILGGNYRAFSQISEANFRGQLHYDDDDDAYFKSCDSETEYKITENIKLFDIYKTITANEESSTPVYVEFTGEINFPNRRSKSSIAMKVEHVDHMALAKASLQCAKAIDTFNFKAKGNVPYWRINTSDNQLFLATKASNQVYTLENTDFEKMKTNYLSAINDKGEKLLLEIKDRHCYIQENNEYWGYSTKIESVYGEFIGCGESGYLTTTPQFKGQYLSQYQDLESHLVLNKNHTLEYKQNDGESSIIKTGFWKTDNPEVVVVMLTELNNKKIQEELIFHRRGNILSTNEINTYNVVSEFEQPLVFKKISSLENSFESKSIKIKRDFLAQHINPKKDIDLAVRSALRKYFKIHDTDPKKTQFSSVRFDLNGDGQDEAIVFLDWCVENKCEMLVFENNNNKLKFSSRVSRVPTPLTISKSLHFSWQSLLTKDKTQWLEFDFDGSSYPLHSREAKKIKEAENATEVILFSEDAPMNWFYIK